MKQPLATLFLFGVLAATGSNTWSAVKLPAIFSDHMVLQREHPVRVWGWDNPQQKVKVEIAGQTAQAVTNADGTWSATLKPLETSAKPLELKVTGSSAVTYRDVLVGEVWLCSGQSNMQWPVSNAKDPDLETLTAHDPQIRLITVPQVGTQKPQDDFVGQWERCSPETVRSFSAVGSFYGRLLHQALQVPVGLIDNAWGGSAAEAWVRRDLLEADPVYRPYVSQWEQKEKDLEANVERWLVSLEAWKKKAAKARAENKRVPRMPRNPVKEMTGQHRPGNLYNGVLHPIIGFTIRGVIWYQGESNSSRAYNYRSLFPLMISHWRDEWGQGDFPFYWVQLADFREEQPEPSSSSWAELREAQTMTLGLPDTGQAVIIDRGEASDIHPKDKQTVAKRLARHALAKDYGIDIVAESPRYSAHQVQGGKVVVHFSHVGSGLDTFDVRRPLGFAVAGKDGQFHWADARIAGKDKIEVWSDAVPNPVAVRYAWADNPVANVQNQEGLPLTPFRTDDWEMVTRPENS